MKKIFSKLIVLLGALLFLVACNSDSSADNNDGSPLTDKIQVVTSIFPVYEITKEIAGDHAEVSLMVGENEDAHHYEPSAQAVAAVNEADVFIYSSQEMEFWVDQLLDVVENEDLKIINLSEGLDLEMNEEANHDHDEANDQEHNHDHGGMDPHFWLDPVAVSKQLPLITEAFIQSNKEDEEFYKANEETFQEMLTELHETYQEAFLKAKNRVFVVQHEAFGHLANRYHLHQVAVGGLTTEVEPNPTQLVEVIDFINSQQVPVIYYQSGENSAIAETVAKETNTEIAVLYDLENRPVSLNGRGNMYIEVMKQNLEQLKLSVN